MHSASFGRWFNRAAPGLFIVVLLLLSPLLAAPYVSADPLRWAYRVYHPGMYRYPANLGWKAAQLEGRTGLSMSIAIAELLLARR